MIESAVNPRKTLKVEALIYILGSILAGGMPLLALPLYAHKLSSESLGEFSVFVLIVGIYNIFCGLSLHGACVRKYYQAEGDVVELSKFMAAAFYLLLITSTLMALITGSMWILDLLPFPIGAKYYYFALIYVTCRYVFLITLGQFQAERNPQAYTLHKTVFVMLEHLLSILLIVYVGLEVDGRIAGLFVTAVVYLLVSLYVLNLKKLLTVHSKKIYMAEALNYGIPLIPHVLAAFFLINLDKIILIRYATTAELGMYYVAFTVASAVGILGETLNRAFVPHIYQNLSANTCTSLRNNNRLIMLYSFGCLLSALVYALSTTVLFENVFPSEYGPVKETMIILIAAQFMRSVYLALSSYATYEHKTYLQSVATVLGLIAAVVYIFNDEEIDMETVALGFLSGTSVQASVILIVFVFLSRKRILGHE